MLIVGKFINGFALGSPFHSCYTSPLLKSIVLGLYVSCAGAYCVEVSPLALRGITTAASNFWIFRKSSCVYFVAPHC